MSNTPRVFRLSFHFLWPCLFKLYKFFPSSHKFSTWKCQKTFRIPNFVTTASESYKTVSSIQVLLDWIHKWKCIFTCNKPFNCSFRIIVNRTCCNFTWFNFAYSKAFDKCKWCCSCTDLAKKIYSLHLMQSTD